MCAGHFSIDFIIKKTPSSLVYLIVCFSDIRLYSVSVKVLQRKQNQCVCVCVCIPVKELAHVTVGVGKSKVCKAARKLGQAF